MTDGRKVKVTENGRILFTGTEIPGAAPWAFWHRVAPDKFIDLPPKYKIEPLEGEFPVPASVIHQDAVRERAQAQVRAGQELSDDISHANRRYLEKLAHSERVYKLRIHDHPLEES